MASNILIGLSICLVFVSAVLVCLGCATDYWIVITVDRVEVKKAAEFDSELLPKISGKLINVSFHYLGRRTAIIFWSVYHPLKGSGLLSTPKCPWKGHIFGMWNQCPLP